MARPCSFHNDLTSASSATSRRGLVLGDGIASLSSAAPFSGAFSVRAHRTGTGAADSPKATSKNVLRRGYLRYDEVAQPDQRSWEFGTPG